MHKAVLQQDLSAVTAACMLMKRKAFEEVGGFEEKLKVAFNDVDLCLKVRKAGYLVVFLIPLQSFITMNPKAGEPRIRRRRSAGFRARLNLCGTGGSRS